MNDLTILDRFGPAPIDLTDESLANARQILDAEMAAPVVTPFRKPRGRRVAALGAAAAVVAGVAGAVVVSPFASDNAVALVRIDPLTFPVTAQRMPAGLPFLRFTFLNANAQDAMYGTDPSCDAQALTCTAARVTLSVRDSSKYWHVPADAASVDVAGSPGRGFIAPGDNQFPEYSIVWTQPDGDVIGVSGEGRYANRAAVERIADSVVDQSQPVDLFLTVAPQGWQLHGFLSDQYLMYGDHGELAVTLIRPGAQLATSADASDVRSVSVGGRPGRIGRDVDGQGPAWVLESTAPDGQAFHLRAPATLTEDDVIQIAAGVRHR